MAPSRIAIVEDHHLARKGLQAIIEELPNCKLVGVYSDIFSFSEALKDISPHILILDDTLPGLDTPHLVRRLKQEYPTLRIIVFANDLSAANIYELFEAKADGFVYEGENLLEILPQAVAFVATGEIFISHRVSVAVMTDHQSNKSVDLSERLKVVLSLMALDFTVKEIAQTLGVTDKAVYNARDRLKEALHVDNPAEILNRAIALNLIEPKNANVIYPDEGLSSVLGKQIINGLPNVRG